MKTTRLQRLRWFNKQRDAFRAGALSPERVAKLESIGFYFNIIDTVAENKSVLIGLAESGKPKPSICSKIGSALRRYTRECSTGFDPEFTLKIQSLRPDWLMTSTDRANDKKSQLLVMAENGETRPSDKKSSLGQCLCRYTNANSKSYDSDFDHKIRDLRQDWFIDTASEKKQILFEMAKNGEAKPRQRKHSLGYMLACYTTPGNICYDQEFDKEIRRLRPDWFVRQSDVADIKKSKILDIAKKGESKPSFTNHPLGRYLLRYTNPNQKCYDPDFNREIRVLRPDWFIMQSDVSLGKKSELLQMAKSGQVKPLQRQHPLGYVLCHYTKPKNRCYDPEFDREIRRLRPDWFTRSMRRAS